MTKFDPEEFLRTPIYAFDFQAMTGDILDFLELSEKTIEWEHRSERQRMRRESETRDFPDGYLEHLLANADHRFTVSMPMRLRFACLVAAYSAVEWEAKRLKARASFKIGDAPPRADKYAHVLACCNEELSLQKQAQIDDFAKLAIVRHAVVHAGGIERDYRFPGDLRVALGGVERLQHIELALLRTLRDNRTGST